MILNISFKQLNSEYSESLAKELEFDEESIINPKYQFEKSIEVTSEIDEIIIKENQDLFLELKLESGEAEKFLVDNMTQLQCIKDNEIVAEYSVSNDLIYNTHKVRKEKSEKTYYYFYLRDREDYKIINDSVYVLEKDFKRLE